MYGPYLSDLFDRLEASVKGKMKTHPCRESLDLSGRQIATEQFLMTARVGDMCFHNRCIIRYNEELPHWYTAQVKQTREANQTFLKSASLNFHMLL